jgi:ATP-binding cassette, subfamily C, bacterial CydC
VRLALLVRPWWRGVTLNLTAALLNQGSGIALAVVSTLLVARVATGIRADELPPYLAALSVLTIAKAGFTWLDMWFAHNVAYGCSPGSGAVPTTHWSRWLPPIP